MLRESKTSILALIVFTLLTGLAFPLAITAIAAVLFPRAARGSLVVEDGIVRGSELVGQSWVGDRWFHGRPSATSRVPYDSMNSAGSNLGTSSAELVGAIEARARSLRAQGIAGPLPVDLLTASGSGLDPHISPAAARAQIERVAATRGIDAESVRALVEREIEGRSLGFLGEPRVNVLALNLALERSR